MASRRSRQRAQARPWDQQRHPIQDLGDDYEDDFDIQHQYARDLFEPEQAAQQKGQQQ
mgnify:CR=1 FL=1